MKNDNIVLSSGLLIKSLVISFFLLAAAFTAGLLMGKNSQGSIDRTSADHGDIQEKLSDCSYRLQEITAKHIKLSDVAKEKGLIDNEGRYNQAVICSAPKIEQVQPVEEKAPEPEKQPKPKTDNAKCLYSIQIFSDTSREMAVAAQKKYELKDTRLVEGIVNEKNWYRVRYGCFGSRSEAELSLPEIKEIVDSALVVAE